MPIRAAARGKATIELVGDIDKAMVDQFLEQLHEAKEKGGDIVLAITSSGGDPDLTRRILLEIERARDAMLLVHGRELDLDALIAKAQRNWYLSAAEAKSLGLIAGVV